MDDKPAIEFHPFGGITLNFDDAPIKLRRCRLGDLAYAKDLLEELRTETAAMRDSWVEEIQANRQGFPPTDLTPDESAAFFAALTPEQRADLDAKLTRINQLNVTVTEANRNLVYKWLSQVAERMGDSNPPPIEEWPLDLLAVQIVDVINHWQSRPLASGKTLGQNGATSEANSSTPPNPAQSSHQVQQQR